MTFHSIFLPKAMCKWNKLLNHGLISIDPNGRRNWPIIIVNSQLLTLYKPKPRSSEPGTTWSKPSWRSDQDHRISSPASKHSLQHCLLLKQSNTLWIRTLCDVRMNVLVFACISLSEILWSIICFSLVSKGRPWLFTSNDLILAQNLHFSMLLFHVTWHKD